MQGMYGMLVGPYRPRCCDGDFDVVNSRHDSENPDLLPGEVETIDESFDTQNEQNWREFNLPVEDY